MGLSRRELDFLILLVEFDRAGTPSLRALFKQKIVEAQESSRLLKNRVKEVTELSSEIKARYYSSWLYSGVRNLTACRGMKSIDHLAEHLKLPRAVIAEIVEFLIQNRLIVESDSGWQPGVVSTYLSSDSPLVNKHHQNWRIKAIQKMDENLEEDLFYTSPMSLSQELAHQLRRHLVDVIEDLHKKTDPSPSQATRCLNLDWFSF